VLEQYKAIRSLNKVLY